MTRPALPGLAGADQQSRGHMPRIETSGTDAAAIAQYGPEHMRAIAAGLTERGLTAHLTDHRVGLDLTATLSPAHLRGAEFWIDEDGYAELRFWYPPGTPPAQITATALRALNAVTSPPPGTAST